MASPALISLVDLFLTQGTYSFSDYEDDRVPAYRGNLTGPIQLQKGLPDLFFGIQSSRSATLTFSNVNTAMGSAGSRFGVDEVDNENGFGDAPYGGTGDPTVTELHRAGDLHGKRVLARIYDLNAAAAVVTLDAFVTDVRLSMAEITITIDAIDSGALTELIPKVRLLDVYGTVDLGNGAVDQDAPVIVVFGIMRKVRLALVYQTTGRYDFGAFRKPASGTLTVNTVYRDRRVVATAEYTLAQSSLGYQVIRFTIDQRDSSGRLMDIQADVTSTEFARPSDAVKFLLTDATFGLGKTANTTSFTTAASDYAAVSYVPHGGLDRRRPARDVLNDLLLRGAALDRNSSGEYTIQVDAAAQHASATLQLGLGDGVWENILPDSPQEQTPRMEERIKTLKLSGLRDPGWSNAETYLLTAQRARMGEGTLREISNPFIGDNTTLDKECDYLFKRLQYAAEQLEVQSSLEASTLAPGQLVTVTIPNMVRHHDVLELRALGYSGSRTGKDMQAAFALSLAGYNANIFTYVAGVVQAAPGANARADYTFTPPDAPTGFVITLAGIQTTLNGQVHAVWSVEATPPAVNVSHLVFQIFRVGEAFPVQQIVRTVPVRTVTYQATFSVMAGFAYDLQCFARNVANNVDFQDGAVAQILNQTAPGDTTAPAQVTGLTAAIGPHRTVLLDWTDLNSALLEGYEINRATDSGFTANLTTFFAALSKFVDSGLANATQYYYRVRGYSKTRTAGGAHISGAFSSTVNVTTARIVTDDYGDSTITNIKVSDVSAVKINTGLLTVNPATGGATAIFVDNAGKVRLKSISGTPSSVIFEDASAVEKAIISGALSSLLTIEPGTDNNGMVLSIGGSGKRWDTILYNAVNSMTFAISSTTLGVTFSVAKFTASGSNVKAFQILNFTALQVQGNLLVNAAVSGAQSNKLRVEDQNGTLIGFIPLYAA